MFFTLRQISKHCRAGIYAAMVMILSAGFFAAQNAVAQSATTGAIGGTVSDASGALLPNTVVTVTSTDTGAVRTLKANAQGEYRVTELLPGSYKASFTADGFQTKEVTAITVAVGSVSGVSPALVTGSITDKIDVTDDTPAMHTEGSAISSVIDQNAIDNLPINGRRWSDFTRLTPGVVSNLSGFGLLSFRGISFLLNNNTVDGADDNQAYYSEARGRTRTAYSIPPQAVQEFQVNTSNYSAQYGRAAGGVINTVTKSGTNSLHGELLFYDRDNGLGGATNPYTLLSQTNPDGTYSSIPTKPKDWRKQWGFGVGGAILRDKLFWFYTYDQEKRNFPAVGRPSDPNDFFASSNATLPAGETCSTSAFTISTLSYSGEGDYNACLIAALYGVSFQAGSAYYHQGLGILQSFIGIVPRTQDQLINLPKLDYQINDRNHLAMTYNRMRYSSPNGLYSQASLNQGRSGFGNDHVKEDFGIVRLTSVLTQSIVNEALAQYGRDFEYDYQQPPIPTEVPLANNQFNAAPGVQIGYYFNSGIYGGANSNLTRFADPDERRLQLLDGVSWSHGKHVSKAGLEFNKVSDYENTLYNGNGSYSYDWTYNYIADYLHATALNGAGVGIGGAGYLPTYYTYSQTFGNPQAVITTREYAGYATDDWRILPNLTLTLGVRYEYEYVPPSPFVNNGNPTLSAVDNGINTALPQTANKPDDRNNIAPRFGFNWNIYGDGKTILRGGYGMYFGRIINSNILQTYLASGAPNAQLQVTNVYPASTQYPKSCGPTYPNIYASFSAFAAVCEANGITIAPTAAYFSSHMQAPQVHEADLALEQNLGHNTTLAITYMMSLGRELPTAIDTNINPLGTAFGTFGLAAPVSATAPKSYPVSTSGEAPTSLAQYPLPPQTGYTVYPHGGKASPFLPPTYQEKFFLNFARPNPAYYQILQVQSTVNSSYNALAFQLDRRYDHGLSVMTNFTWAHALDGNPYQSTVVPSYTATDPTNPRADYGNSVNDVRMRYVGAVVYEPQTHFESHWIQEALSGWRIAPLVQLQTGLPYSPTISSSSFKSITETNGTTGTLAGTGINGAGSGATRVPWIGRDSYNYPKTAVFDLRVGKNFYLPKIGRFGINSTPRFEIFAELFNVMNHQNITGITTEAYTLADVSGNNPVQTLTPYQGFGQYTNSNSNYTYSSRQLQIAGRLHF